METATNDDSVHAVFLCLADPLPASRSNGDTLPGAIQFLTSVPNPKEFPHQQSDQSEYRLDRMLYLLSAISERGLSVDATDAVEHALARSEILAEEDLDSEYWSDSVRRELLRLHRPGSDRARPDAMALAGRWARMRRSSRLGWFDDFTEP
ncbi:MAG: hypothetical protein L6Q38_14420 [Nitrospira sp.]|nr:hypothetical protein [Nitrospira sp.]